MRVSQDRHHDQRIADVQRGSFGNVGQYEKLIGTATGEIDPADRHNTIIQDVQLAPRNANGKVEYTASFTLVKPIDMSKGNGRLFYNINNRGNRNFPYNIGGDPGDGFVQSRGYTLLFSGWQGDVVPAANNGNEWVQVPTAKNADGSSVTGPVIYRASNIPAGTNTVAFTSVPPGGFTAFPYRPVSLDTNQSRHARPLPRDQYVPEDRRDVRRDRILGFAHGSGSVGNRRSDRYSAALERAPLLFSGHDARWRKRRIQH
jgi:hypothetical protein